MTELAAGVSAGPIAREKRRDGPLGDGGRPDDAFISNGLNEELGVQTAGVVAAVEVVDNVEVFDRGDGNNFTMLNTNS